MAKWVRNYKGDKQCKDYMVTCFILMDEIGGYFLGEYEISIHSWHKDFYSKKFKTADSFSEHRYKKAFKDKSEANKIWKWITENEPNYKQLENAGFTKSMW